MNNILKPVIIVLAALVIGFGVYIFLIDPLTEPALPVEDPIVEVADDPTPPAIEIPTYHDFVQLSSHRTAEEAARAVRIHGSELKGLVSQSLLQVYQVTIASGTWYRVVLPQPSRADAESTCARIKAKGKDCLVYSFNG